MTVGTCSKTAQNLHGRLQKQRNYQAISGKISGEYQAQILNRVRLSMQLHFNI